jgi:alpha-tubulin suppressor-like RCC1 family protein
MKTSLLLTKLLLFLFLVHFCKTEIWNWGNGFKGQLGDGTQQKVLSPQILKSSSSLLSGSDFNSKIIKKLSCGGSHCLILTGFLNFLTSVR